MSQKYDEELWYKMPGSAWLTLGRRGREEISLRQCLVPKCGNLNKKQDSIHPIKMDITSEDVGKDNLMIRKKKFLMHCDVCGNDYNLVFSQYIDKDRDEDLELATVMEEVSAENADGTENYGQVGHTQIIR